MMDIRGLAYIITEHPEPLSWQTFSNRVLGMQSRIQDSGDVWLKMDERAFRILVQPGSQARYLASGWELPTEAAFASALADLESAGVEVRRGSAGERAQRNCIDLARFADPSGNQHEIVLGFKTDFERFVSPTGTSFVTGDLGMGHTVLPCPNFDTSWKFFRDVMGFGLGDFMNHRPSLDASNVRIFFLHCNNARHHSLAIAEMPTPSACIHLMLEVPDMDEVGRAMDRRAKEGAKLMATLGRHVNDHMTSFYLQSPSHFAIEYGYGGRLVDWSRNVVHETTVASLWGHDFSLGFGNAGKLET